jgi:ElaB/YqjD/DUF883 family membrane-anchored ribosome-binding protein
MVAEAELIKKHIEETRDDLGTHLSELEYRMKTATDWRVQVQRRPTQAIAAAFCAGLLAALLISVRS